MSFEKSQKKKLFDKKHRIKSEKMQRKNMILLHDIRLDNQHFEKLTFC